MPSSGGRSSPVTPGLVLESVASAQFAIPFQDPTLRNVEGRWEPSSSRPSSRSVARSCSSPATGSPTTTTVPTRSWSREAYRDIRPVWAAALAFSGNTKTVVEQTQYGQTLLQLGVNDFDLELTLLEGETFTTPPVVALYSEQGLEDVSHRLHAFGRSLMSGGIGRFCTTHWEATNFDVTCDGQIALAESAAAVGAELFVVDDGWLAGAVPTQPVACRRPR